MMGRDEGATLGAAVKRRWRRSEPPRAAWRARELSWTRIVRAVGDGAEMERLIDASDHATVIAGGLHASVEARDSADAPLPA